MRNWGAGKRRSGQCRMRSSKCGIGARGTITSGDAFLLRRFVVGLRLEMRFCCNAFHRFALGDAVLAGRFAIDLCHCLQFCCRVYRRFTPAVCLATNRTACGILRSYSAGARSPLCVLAVSVRLSAFVGSLRVCAFLAGDPDGLLGTRGNGAGGAALVRLCAIALALKCFPRGVR